MIPLYLDIVVIMNSYIDMFINDQQANSTNNPFKYDNIQSPGCIFTIPGHLLISGEIDEKNILRHIEGSGTGASN